MIPLFRASTLRTRLTQTPLIMRTSRVARETARLFDSLSPSADLPPRRSTRSSTFARFSYTPNGVTSVASSPAASSNVKTENNDDDDVDEEVDTKNGLEFGSDIEDAVKPSVSPPARRTGTVTRKRKRTATTVAAKKEESSSSPEGKVKLKVKLEAESDSEFEVETKPALPSRSRISIKSGLTDSEPETKSKPQRAPPRKPARKQTNPLTGQTTILPPSNWEEVYAVAKEMRLPGGTASNAAVDTMGCERLALASASPRDRRFHTLVALMLSSQTKDTVNAEAMARLQKELPACAPGKPAGLNLENMLAVEPGLLNELIGKVGFHNNKTKYVPPLFFPSVYLWECY